MSQAEIKPQFDKHGVGWCWHECPLYRSSAPFACHTQLHYNIVVCRDADSEVFSFDQVCPTWARLAAKDHAAMEEVRNRVDSPAGITGMPILRLAHVPAARSTWQVEMDGLVRSASDPAEAILKVAEAAEKKTKETFDEPT